MGNETTWLELEAIEKQLHPIMVQQLGVDPAEVDPEARMIEDLGCDSLDLIELFMEVEDEFHVTIPDTRESPIGKLLFARTPFRVRDFAELIYVNQGTGSPVRTPRLKRVIAGESDVDMPFYQLGGRCSSGSSGAETLWEPIERDAGSITKRRVRDGMVCVQIPSQEIQIGSRECEAANDEQPQHIVRLSSFLIDIEPVSVTAFCRFLNSIPDGRSFYHSHVQLRKGDKRLSQFQIQWRDDHWLPKKFAHKQPMVLVNWFAASAYSLWAHGLKWQDDHAHKNFLPTEAQWECAAAGAYAEGTAPLAFQHQRGGDYRDGPMPIANVNESLGVSRYGLRHMSGTIWHWCRDWYDENFYKADASRWKDAINDSQTNARSERGGSWVGPAELGRTSYRRGRNPNACGRCLGFRCVHPQ